MSFVNIYVSGTTLGTTTDADGNYILKLPYGEYEVNFSIIGYKSQKKKLLLTNKELLVNVYLSPVSYELPEVVVTGEDPGTLIMRRMIEKKINQTKNLFSYSYNLYTKFYVSTDTVTAGRSSQDGDTTIFSIFESYSIGYYKQPNKYFNKIIQRRQSANVPPQANFVTFGTNINAFDDYVTVISEEIATPFHPDAINFYDFKLENWFSPDNNTNIAVIKITPKSTFRKLFNGYVFIDGVKLIPLEVSLTPSIAVKLPFNATLTYRQYFTESDGFIVPTNLQIKSNIPIDIYWIFDARLDIQINTVAYDYKFNLQLDDNLFEQRRVEADKSADTFDEKFWDENSVLPLSEKEVKAYDDIKAARENPDSIFQASFVDRYIGVVTREIAKLDRSPFTGFDDFFRFNRVEGAFLGGGYIYADNDKFKSYVKVGYSFADKKPKGELFNEYFLDEYKKYSVSLNLFSRLNRRDDPNFFGARSITMLSLLFKNDYGDYYYSSGYNLEFKAGFGQLRFIHREIFERPYTIKLAFRDETNLSADVNTEFSFLGRRQLIRDNHKIFNGRLRSLYTEWNYDYSPLRRMSDFGFQLSYEYSSNKILKSDFEFKQVKSIINFRTTTLPLWTLDMRLAAGKSFGKLPPQRYFSVESSASSFAQKGAFRGVKLKEFYGEDYATFFVEHNFGEVIPGLIRIPNVASFGVELIINGNIGFTKFNNPAEVKVLNPLLTSTEETKEKYYYEAGVALNRLLLFFRFDLSARISQLSTPQYRFTFSIATN
ncbi:MAG: carboxypeptidase-like regulatory domain-containing protein [Ignavibacteriaceae bacterium]|nr:carboxypeptidase-like regulatory domain-containing protein [Ignavibacteriaceae bacterium]